MIDEVDLVAQEGVAKRKADAAARKALRRALRDTPESKRSRDSKRKGYETEVKFEKQLAEFGFERVPLSGALGHGKTDPLSHDLRRVGGIASHIESKRRTGECREIRKWLEQQGADVLIVDTGGRDVPLVVMRLEMFKAYLEVERDG